MISLPAVILNEKSDFLVNFQITDKSHDSAYRHYFFRAKSFDEKINIIRLINQFIVYSKCKLNILISSPKVHKFGIL